MIGQTRAWPGRSARRHRSRPRNTCRHNHHHLQICFAFQLFALLCVSDRICWPALIDSPRRERFVGIYSHRDDRRREGVRRYVRSNFGGMQICPTLSITPVIIGSVGILSTRRNFRRHQASMSSGRAGEKGEVVLHRVNIYIVCLPQLCDHINIVFSYVPASALSASPSVVITHTHTRRCPPAR